MREHCGDKIATLAGSFNGTDKYTTTIDDVGFHNVYTVANLEAV